MCLLLTNDSPSIDTLGHLPPLPLVIDYSDRTETIARKDEDNIHLGLQQHGLVRRVVLEAQSSSLRVWLELMNELFPRLKDLCLFSTTVEEGNLTLHETLQAPGLRRLSLHGIGLPNGLSLLSSVTALSTLSLTQIRSSCYFSPGDLVTQLQCLPYLEELSIGFAISTPLPSSEGELLRAPILRVTLPTLRRITFRGEDVYLDNLVAQVNTPLLERLGLTFVFDIIFTLVNLTEFMHRTEGFSSGCFVSRVIFNKDGASVNAGHYEQWDVGRLSLHVNCEPLDWQIGSATQVCSALGNVMSGVEDLTLDLDADGMPSDWNHPVDNREWHELLIPFIGVKKLHIGSSITLELSQALESVAGGLILELLPELQELEVQFEIGHTKNAFLKFVKNRESVGHPIHLLAHRINPSDQILSPQYGSYDVSGTYRNQAINLISMCQTFIQAQEQTIRSYDKLRR
jgi:hypothetical protein